MNKRSAWLLGVVAAGVLVAGVAVASQSTDRYFMAIDNLTKATALVNATTPVNKHESRQRTKALKALAAATADLECAIAREADPGAACP